LMAPRYRDISAADIPVVTLAKGSEIKIICGRVGDVVGPVTDVVIEPQYLDVSIPAGATFTHPTPAEHTVFAYVHNGSGRFDDSDQEAGNRSLLLFEPGDQVVVSAGEDGVRFLLVSGKPLQEPIAWGGPIVMNTQEELEQAFDELRNGNFIKGN
ncbi:MAG: hypothetical protein C0622_08905, partial [Desulfuromonas sp.]